MSVNYVAVQWNRHKRFYDAWLVGGVIFYLASFLIIGSLVWDGSFEILLIRSLGTCAIVMLHIILSIGPLARLSTKFNPLLYNRRHFGVLLFFIALAHGLLSLMWYHGFGVVNPIVSLFTSSSEYTSFIRFPFQPLGFAALVILFLMAATSHDFWLKNLSPRVWKTLHMLVYLAYALVVMHVALGLIQTERNMVYPALLGLGVVVISALHIASALRSRQSISLTKDGWVDAGLIDSIENHRGKTIELPSGERVAVFRYDGKVSAMTNVCAHQMGPLGEGKVIDGCVTCPWHGYQYLPGNGQSPPPFTEKIATHDVRIDAGRIFVRSEPNAPGTPTEPASIGEGEA